MNYQRTVLNVPFSGRAAAKSVWLVLLVVCLAYAGISPPAFGQQSVTSATLTGRVEDAGGGCVCGAEVCLTNTTPTRSGNRLLQPTMTDVTSFRIFRSAIMK